MPYVNQLSRLARCENNPSSAGELNYAITLMLKEYLQANGVSYNTMNEILGVVECVKTEFYRRVMVPYEELKRIENGDVY